MQFLRADNFDYSVRLENCQLALDGAVTERDRLRDEVRVLHNRLDQRFDNVFEDVRQETERVRAQFEESRLRTSLLEGELIAAYERQEGFQNEISSLTNNLDQYASQRTELARSVLYLSRRDVLPFLNCLGCDMDVIYDYVSALTPHSFDTLHLLCFIHKFLDGFRSIIHACQEGQHSIVNSLPRPTVASDYASFFSAEMGPSAFDYAIRANAMVRPNVSLLVYPPDRLSPVIPNSSGLNTMLFDSPSRSSSVSTEVLVRDYDSDSNFEGSDELYTDSDGSISGDGGALDDGIVGTIGL